MTNILFKFRLSYINDNTHLAYKWLLEWQIEPLNYWMTCKSMRIWWVEDWSKLLGWNNDLNEIPCGSIGGVHCCVVNFKFLVYNKIYDIGWYKGSVMFIDRGNWRWFSYHNTCEFRLT